MKRIDCILIGDGTSDEALIYPLKWLLSFIYPDNAFEIEFVKTSPLKRKPNLSERICHAYNLYSPCDIIFIHRDAENQDYDFRKEEINKSIQKANCPISEWIPVIPIRMSEAWFLFDKQNIRTAAGNPNGVIELKLPQTKDLENLPNPKEILHELLLDASELNKRQRKKLKPHKMQHRLAAIIEDYSPLLILNAFDKLKIEIQKINL